MNLDRGLIKAQAKELIRGKVMKLFLTVLIVELIALAPNIVNTVISAPQYKNFMNSYNDIFDFDDAFDFDDEFNNYQFENDDDYNPYADDFENFGTDNNSGKSDFYSFGTNFVPTDVKTEIAPQKAAISTAAANAISILIFIAQILLMPLAVTLAYFFVLFIRGKEFNGADGVKFVLKESFTNNYGNKIGVVLLKGLITAGLGIISVFILYIPMFIFLYSSYFAYEIMCDNPQLSPWQAIKLSKKMIKGNRTELFVLDLTFIPWMLSCVFLFPAIYALPYIYTTKALYYENFRLRAIQQGRVCEDDFLTDLQRMQKYANQNNGANYQQNPNSYQQNPYNPQQPNAQQTKYQGAYQQSTGTYQYSTTYQEVQAEPKGTCDASPVQAPPFYTSPQANVQQSAPTVEPQAATPPVDEPQATTPDSVGGDAHIGPQTASEPAETTESSPQAEPLRPSEKYTPAAPPTENYTPTEDTNE